MTVNYEVLLDWPDAASIGSAAEGLAQYGTSFSDTFSSANSIWGRLGSCYETPHQGYLFTAFEPAVRDAESAAKGSAVAATEMGALQPFWKNTNREENSSSPRQRHSI